MAGSTPRELFAERLAVPWWWWPVGAACLGLVAAELHAGYAGWRSWLPYLLAAGLLTAGLLTLGRARVGVVGGELWAGPAHLPASVISGVRVLDRDAVRLVMGRQADPAAFTLVRAWIPAAVWLRLDDPADDTPYWLVSSRRPADLAAAVDRARAEGQGRPPSRSG